MKITRQTGRYIVNKLLERNKSFVEGELSKKEILQRRDSMRNGQKPYVTVLTCSDSRVIPEFIFDANIGEIFVIRVAGDICDNSVLGSIEYGVEHLKTPLLVVLGHSKCGAVTAACASEGKRAGDNIDYILDKITPAVKEGNIEASIEENLRIVEKEILENSEVSKKLVDGGRLTIIKMKYILDTGEVKEIKG